VCARDDGAIWEADGDTLLCGSQVFYGRRVLTGSGLSHLCLLLLVGRGLRELRY
jgi:hypothetical protein